MSVIEVSVLAGDVLSVLEQRGRAMRLEQIVAHCCCTRETALLALGRLLQEGLVAVEPGIGDWVVIPCVAPVGLQLTSRHGNTLRRSVL